MKCVLTPLGIVLNKTGRVYTLQIKKALIDSCVTQQDTLRVTPCAKHELTPTLQQRAVHLEKKSTKHPLARRPSFCIIPQFAAAEKHSILTHFFPINPLPYY